MTFKTYEINVDLVNDTSTTSTNRFSQNDRNSAKLLLTITNKGEEIDLSKAKSVRMSFKKPDGTRVFQNDCQPINAMKGKYQIVLKTQTLTSVGNVIAQIHIEEEDRILDTQKFLFVVNDSLASDEAIESTNEFTIIQKAIEAGTKLEKVDIDGIIAAGAKADAALPKAGGTMTGDLIINGSNKVIAVKGGNNVQLNQSVDANGDYYWYSTPSAKTPLKYTGSTDTLNILAANTNLYKKTDLYPDWLQPNGNTKSLSTTPDLNTVVNSGNYGGTGLVNAPEGRSSYFYVEVVRYSDNKYCKQVATDLTTYTPKVYTRVMNNNVWGEWIQQIDAKGGTLTGNLTFNRPAATSYQQLLFQTNGVGDINIGQNSTGKFVMYDQAASTQIWEYDKATKAFNVTTTNTNLVTKTKDGQVDMVVTADGEVIDGTNTPNVARRRGNTVSLRIALRRKVGSADSIVATIPADMRPASFVIDTAIATDGTPVRVTVEANGGVKLSAEGKGVYTNITYVVD